MDAVLAVLFDSLEEPSMSQPQAAAAPTRSASASRAPSSRGSQRSVLKSVTNTSESQASFAAQACAIGSSDLCSAVSCACFA